MDAQLPVVAVDYMRRERRGAVLQCGGNNQSTSIKQLLCLPPLSVVIHKMLLLRLMVVHISPPTLQKQQGLCEVHSCALSPLYLTLGIFHRKV